MYPPHELPNTHPTERDLYIDIVYSDRTDTRLSESEIDEIERLWNEELTPNRIVHVHIRNGVPEAGTANEIPGDGLTMADVRRIHSSYAAGAERHMIYVTPTTANRPTGRAAAGGEYGWVDENAPPELVTHETVHMIAGDWSPPCDTTRGHTCSGIMQAEAEGTYSSEATAFTIRQLRDDWE